MEFFGSVNGKWSEAALQENLTIERLPSFCASIDRVLDSQGEQGNIYCIWGEFSVSRALINGGVRFSLTSCPNALSWTVTSGHEPVPEDTVIHLTINRRHHEFDFIDSIHDFVSDWEQGLEHNF